MSDGRGLGESGEEGVIGRGFGQEVGQDISSQNKPNGVICEAYGGQTVSYINVWRRKKRCRER